MAAQDVALKHGRYYDAAVDGRLFHASPAATGVAPGTAIGTTAAFSLHNPLGSAVDLAILIASMAYISGTLGAGGGVAPSSCRPAARTRCTRPPPLAPRPSWLSASPGRRSRPAPIRANAGGVH